MGGAADRHEGNQKEWRLRAFLATAQKGRNTSAMQCVAHNHTGVPHHKFMLGCHRRHPCVLGPGGGAESRLSSACSLSLSLSLFVSVGPSPSNASSLNPVIAPDCRSLLHKQKCRRTVFWWWWLHVCGVLACPIPKSLGPIESSSTVLLPTTYKIRMMLWQSWKCCSWCTSSTPKITVRWHNIGGLLAQKLPERVGLVSGGSSVCRAGVGFFPY